jgi:RF-1 domain
MATGEFIFQPHPHPASLSVDDLLAACEWGRDRASGPGGQHRNKVESAVWIRHVATGVEAQAAERRSAVENKRVATGRLRRLLAVEVRCPVAIGEIRSSLWKSRCSPAGVIACNPDHADFASLLAEALDVIFAAGWDVKKASLRLCCSQSQLIKLVKDFPPAFARLNKEREAAGLHALK